MTKTQNDNAKPACACGCQAGGCRCNPCTCRNCSC